LWKRKPPPPLPQNSAPCRSTPSTYERGDEFDCEDEELERRFLAFFDQLVQEGTLTRQPDADPAMGRRILGPRRWLRAQRIRINRLVAHWHERG
jgi:hypothetical protein